MSKSAANNTLQRPILDGTTFNALFSSSNCTPTFLGNGDTKFTITQMKKQVLIWVKEFNTKKAQQLFSKPTLQATVTNIHSFLYNHYQYNADGWDQNLRSPKCSWASRYDGIDCKSYATTASVLLYILNIKHYLRRIKQPFHQYPNKYTHVYVVVPNDQKTGSLTTQGYFTIDGTLPTMQEPVHTNPHDIFMSDKMAHYALNGTGVTDGTNFDLGTSNSDVDSGTSGTTDASMWNDAWGSVKDSATGGESGEGGWLSDIDWGGTIGGLFSGGGGSVSCPYGEVQLTTDLTNISAVTQQNIEVALSPDLTISEKETILTDLYYNVSSYVLMVQATNYADTCTHQATTLLVNAAINDYLPSVFSTLQQSLAANGITMRLFDTQKEGVDTKTVRLNTGITSGASTTSDTSSVTNNSPTGSLQDNDPPKKSSNTGKVVAGLAVLTIAGFAINEYMKSKTTKKDTK